VDCAHAIFKRVAARDFGRKPSACEAAA